MKVWNREKEKGIGRGDKGLESEGMESEGMESEGMER